MYLPLHNTKYWRLDTLPIPKSGLSEAFRTDFLINRLLRTPRKLSWVYIIEMRIKKVKTPFYQPSSFYLEMIITHIIKQPKFTRCYTLHHTAGSLQVYQ